MYLTCVSTTGSSGSANWPSRIGRVGWLTPDSGSPWRVGENANPAGHNGPPRIDGAPSADRPGRGAVGVRRDARASPAGPPARPVGGGAGTPREEAAAWVGPGPRAGRRAGPLLCRRATQPF